MSQGTYYKESRPVLSEDTSLDGLVSGNGLKSLAGTVEQHRLNLMRIYIERERKKKQVRRLRYPYMNQHSPDPWIRVNARTEQVHGEEDA
jgi:hypothetical protein